MHTTKIRKWGNSYAVRLPKELVTRYELAEETVVFAEKEGAIQISLVRDYANVKELITAITPKNRHAETDWGRPVRGEIW